MQICNNFLRRASGKSRRAASHRNICEHLEQRRLLSVTPITPIPTTIFNITGAPYNAVADGVTNNAVAINKAITDASNNLVNGVHGGIVEIPAAAKAFESGPITMLSNVNLQIDGGGTLQCIPMASYPGQGSTSVVDFITASNRSNFEISGSGTIDGNGAAWWAAFNANGNIDRPRLIQISNGNKILIQNVTLKNPGQFHVAFGNTSNVTIDSVTISTPSTGPNTDGIDPAGQHYLIENCNISTGDDNIAVKPQSVQCGDITITGCTFGTGHGVSVGGQTNDGFTTDGMTVTNCTFTNTTNGLRLKADRGNGGLVQNVSYSNLTMTGVQFPILIDSYYNGGNALPADPSADTTTSSTATPVWQNISFTNITSTNSASNSVAGVIYGLPEAKVQNVNFTNVKITARRGLQINHARNVTFDSTCVITATTGNDLYGNTSNFPSPYDATILAAGFSDSDVGSPTPIGNTLYDPDTFAWTIAGGGADIGASSDQFNFASTGLTGDGKVVARVTSQSNTNAAAKAGVMMRTDNTAGSAFASLSVTPGSGLVFQWRSAAGGAATSTTVNALTAPLWLEVARSGNGFSGFYSNDGASWTQIGTTQILSTNPSLLAGLGVTSHNTASLSSAGFTNVAVTAGTSFAVLSGTTLNLNFDQAADAMTLGNDAGNVTVLENGVTLSFVGVNSVVANFVAGAGDILNIGGTVPAALNFINGGVSATLNINAGTATLAAGTLGAGFDTITLGTVTVASGAELALAQPPSSGDRTVLILNALTIAGSLGNWQGLVDLGANDLIVHQGDLATLTDQIRQGFNGLSGFWNGTAGITSSAAGAGGAHALGLELNDDGSGGTLKSSFDDAPVGSADVLVKYTVFGDADLSGDVTSDDYTLIDTGFNSLSTGWHHGDFTYDGTINGDDYTLIDNAFNMQANAFAEVANTSAAINKTSGGTAPKASVVLPAVAIGASSSVFQDAKPIAASIDQIVDSWTQRIASENITYGYGSRS